MARKKHGGIAGADGVERGRGGGGIWRRSTVSPVLRWRRGSGLVLSLLLLCVAAGETEEGEEGTRGRAGEDEQCA